MYEAYPLAVLGRLVRLGPASRLTRACLCGVLREALSPVLFWE